MTQYNNSNRPENLSKRHTPYIDQIINTLKPSSPGFACVAAAFGACPRLTYLIAGLFKLQFPRSLSMVRDAIDPSIANQIYSCVTHPTVYSQFPIPYRQLPILKPIPCLEPLLPFILYIRH